MIGRISTNQFSQTGLNSILDAQSQVSKLQTQMATGKRIQTASDDPQAAAQLSSLKSELSRMEVLQRNIDAANTSLSIEESTLGSINEALARARELSIQGNSSALSDNDREMLALELDQIFDHLLSLANTRNVFDEYIFAGSATDAPAYDQGGVFQGDEQVRELNIAPGVTIKTGDSGVDVFEEIDGDANIFDIVSSIAEALRSPDAGDPSERGEAILASQAQLDIAMERVNSVRASTGTRLNRLDDHADLNAAFSLQVTQSISSLEDLDFAAAASELNVQMVSLQAAQQVYVKTQNLTIFNYL
jgi:flagellar hook-associated protein 3 FlgL